MESNSSAIYYREITSVFGCTNSPPERGVHLEHFLTGNYSVRLEHDFGATLTNDGSEFIISSNELTFKVEEPTKKTEIAQLAEFKSLMKNFSKYTNESFEDKINKIVKIDNKSPYSLLAEYHLIQKYKALIKPTKYQKLMEKACFKNPESFVSLTYAMYDKTVLKKMAENKNLKSKMIGKYSKKIKKSRAKIRKVQKYNDHHK